MSFFKNPSKQNSNEGNKFVTKTVATIWLHFTCHEMNSALYSFEKFYANNKTQIKPTNEFLL